LQRREDVQRVVFVMHGIRDNGEWTREVARCARTFGAARGETVETVTSSYGYFPMGAFLLFGSRQRNVRWFMDQYTEALARYPQAEFSFIGHSNGTYLLGSTLRRYKTPRFDRVVLAGSVLPRAFEWDDFVQQGRVGTIQNYVATGDWVVGWFPALFEFCADLLQQRADLGSAGHNGFLANSTHQHAIVYARGGHGAALTGTDEQGRALDNYGNLARFAIGEEVDARQIPMLAAPSERSRFVDVGHRFCPLVWAAILALVGILACLPVWWACFRPDWRHPTPPDWQHFSWGWIGTVLVLLWLVLRRF
ncbi:MAG: hypothetical protein KIT22_17540, partial [Verrucomicrobiae bacterium]|nr:hypothetical protein [Verrucomicrobiae bacterium]